MATINLSYNQLGGSGPQPQGGVPSVAGLDQAANSMQNLANIGADTILAFDDNRRDVELAKATTDALKEIENQAFEFKHNDAEFSTQNDRYQEFYQGLESRYSEQLKDPEQFSAWQQNVDGFAFNKGLDIKESVLKRDAEDQIATLSSTLSDISGIAIRGDEEQFDESVQKAEGLIEHAFEIGVLDTAERDNAKRTFNNELSRGKVRQDITLDPKAALDKIRAGEYKALGAEEQSQFEAMAISKIAQTKNKSNAVITKQSKELVSDTILSLKNGYLVQDKELTAARAASAVVGMEEELSIAVASSQFVTLPKQVRDDMPEQIEGVQNAELRLALEVANETIEKELDKDGYAFAVDQRVVDEIPLDLSDPASIQGRIEQTEYLKQHYGRPVSPLKSQEADVLIEALPAMSPNQKSQLALTLGASEEIWKQLDKKNAGLFAMTGAIGDQVVMEGVFKGKQLLDNKMVELAESREQLLSSFDSRVGDIYTGRDRAKMFDAAKAYYASLVGPGAEKGFFANDTFEDAIEAVTGGIGKINGEKLELPRGVLQDDFEDFVDNISPETIASFGGVWSMSDKEAAELVKSSRIVSYSANQYMVVVNDARLSRKDGKPFLFTFSEKAKKEDEARVMTRDWRITRQAQEDLEAR